MIANQIIDLVTDSDLVVADLTDANANVFYELAVRHVTQLPFGQLIQDGQSIPFDVTVMRTISYDMTDPFNIEDRKKALGEAIDAAENGEPIETPISSAVELKQRRNSGASSIVRWPAYRRRLQNFARSFARRNQPSFRPAFDLHLSAPECVRRGP